MMDEVKLKAAAGELEAALIKELPDEKERDHEFSDSFRRKMKKVIFRANHPVMSSGWRRAVAAVLAITLLGGSALIVRWKINSGAAQLEDPKMEIISIEEVEKPGESMPFLPEWLPVTEEKAYTKNTVALVGRVLNPRTIAVTYQYDEREYTEYIPLFDLEIETVLYNHSGNLPVKKVITIGSCYEYYTVDQFQQIVEQDKVYLVYCYVLTDSASSDENTNLIEQDKLLEYFDCYVGMPNMLIVEKVSDQYLATEFFAPYFPGVEPIQDKKKLYPIPVEELETVIKNTAEKYTP